MDNTSWDWPLAKGEAKDPLVPSDKKEIDGAKHWLRLPYLPWLATLLGGLATAKKTGRGPGRSGSRHEEGTLEDTVQVTIHQHHLGSCRMNG